MRLRDALNYLADNPDFIETIERRGYPRIGPILANPRTCSSGSSAGGSGSSAGNSGSSACS